MRYWSCDVRVASSEELAKWTWRFSFRRIRPWGRSRLRKPRPPGSIICFPEHSTSRFRETHGEAQGAQPLPDGMGAARLFPLVLHHGTKTQARRYPLVANVIDLVGERLATADFLSNGPVLLARLRGTRRLASHGVAYNERRKLVRIDLLMRE